MMNIESPATAPTTLNDLLLRAMNDAARYIATRNDHYSDDDLDYIPAAADIIAAISIHIEPILCNDDCTAIMNDLLNDRTFLDACHTADFDTPLFAAYPALDPSAD